MPPPTLILGGKFDRRFFRFLEASDAGTHLELAD